MSSAEAVLLVNVRARMGAELFERAREELVRAGVLLRDAIAVEDPSTIPERVAAALKGGADRVVVGGGDGTQAAAASALAGTGAALGVLPLGTANDFARSLGIPLDDLREAASAFAAGEVREIDVGRAGERAFLNAASVGISGELTRKLDPTMKRVAGALAYPAAGVAAATDVRPFRVRLEIDGVIHAHDALQVVIGNGRYHGGGRLVAPAATLDDRRLDVYVVEAATGAGDPDGTDLVKEVARLARYALLLAVGRHLDHPGIHHHRARLIRLETEPSLEVDADGELACSTPAIFSVAPGLLRVIAPAGA